MNKIFKRKKNSRNALIWTIGLYIFFVLNISLFLIFYSINNNISIKPSFFYFWKKNKAWICFILNLFFINLRTWSTRFIWTIKSYYFALSKNIMSRMMTLHYYYMFCYLRYSKYYRYYTQEQRMRNVIFRFWLNKW